MCWKTGRACGDERVALECVEGWKGVDCGMLKKRGYERGGYRNVMEGRKGAGGLGGRAFGRVGISRALQSAARVE